MDARHVPHPDAPRYNARELVTLVVAGQIANALVRGSPWRIGRDGVVRVVPGTGGIALDRRVGDRAVGLAGDHVEPGAAIRNNDRESVGPPAAANRGLLVNACVGDVVRVVSGPATGAVGSVTGKHGGIDHVLVDFPPAVLRTLRIGDRVQIHAVGQGLRLVDFPGVTALNLSPRLLRRWGLRAHGARLHVPCTHVVPGGLMGSGLGRSDAVLGDTDIQLARPAIVRALRLDQLRFGDLVAITPFDARHGASHRDAMTIGVVVHSDSRVAGHGPGVTALLAASDGSLRPVFSADANLARILALRSEIAPLAQPEARERMLWSRSRRRQGESDRARRIRAPA